jgi:uncharacterized heparinase superfamily protein
METTPDHDGQPDEPDGIAPGKRLVRQAGGGVSLGDRIMARFYRLIWQTPLHTFRLKGRHPLKLSGVPEDPIAGDREIGAALAAGLWVVQGEVQQTVSGALPVAPSSAAFHRAVHGFSWLRDLALIERADATGLAEKLTHAWLDAHADTVSEPAWAPDVTARRLLFWAAYAPLILSSTDLVYRSSVLNHFARAGRHLDGTAERMPQGVQRITSWCGVVAAGLLIAGNEPRRLFGEAGLAKALASGITSDGGVLCRSPDAQADVLEALLMLRAVYAMRKLPCPDAVEDAIVRAAPVLAGMVLGDGGLSSWQGCVPGPHASAVLAAIGGVTRPLRQTREWGYQRLSSGGVVLISDTAPPPLAHLTSNGCASTLAIEFSDGDQRIIVNCGGSRAGGIAAMKELAEGLRTTAAHSTLTLADSNSTAILKAGAIGKGVAETALDRQEIEAGSRIEASHDGYLKRFGFTHQRSVALSADGSEVRGEDTLLPGARKRKGETGFAVRFHLAPGIEPSLTADALGALLRLPDGRMWQFRARGGALAVEESVWVGPDGLPRGTHQLVISGQSDPGGATIGWIFKRAS